MEHQVLTAEGPGDVAWTGGSTATWKPRVIVRQWTPGAFEDECRRLTPSNEELLRRAETSPPPPSWYDETDDPFAPAA